MADGRVSDTQVSERSGARLSMAIYVSEQTPGSRCKGPDCSGAIEGRMTPPLGVLVVCRAVREGLESRGRS